MGSKKLSLIACILVIGIAAILVLIGTAMGQISSNPIAGGWLYRQITGISNSDSNLTDYNVTMDTAYLISARKMRSDCADIRFADSDGSTQLNYQLESGCNTISTKLWVKVPSVPPEDDIYVYYSNFEANSMSDEKYVVENIVAPQELQVNTNVPDQTIRRVGDGIYFEDGSTLLIKKIDSNSGNVWTELQLNDSTIGNKILSNSDSENQSYNFGEYVVTLVNVSHDTTGDYVILGIAPPLAAYFELIISTVPQGANISIDNEYKGKTKKTIPIGDFEEHSLSLNLNGYDDEEITFKFQQNEGKKEIQRTLRKIQPTTNGTTGISGGILTNVTTTGIPVATTSPVESTESSTPVPTGISVETAKTPAPTLITPITSKPTQAPGFFALTFILAILWGYFIFKKNRHR
jgi:hypothetical protein